jgi:hypothetical protein
MRKFVQTTLVFSMVAGLACAAAAQDKPAAKPAPTPAAPKPAVPAAPTPTAIKPATPTPAPGVKPAPTDKAPTQPQPPVMGAPKAPVEIADYVKAATGTWRCTGKTFMPDGTSMDMKATMKAKFSLDKFWAQTSYAELKKNGYKFESFRTFDGKKWHSVMMDNWGGQEVGTSDGPKEGKVVWEVMSRSAMGDGRGRHYEEMVGKEMKMWGEYSMDKGKTWAKAYEASCKK